MIRVETRLIIDLDIIIVTARLGDVMMNTPLLSDENYQELLLLKLIDRNRYTLCILVHTQDTSSSVHLYSL